MEIGIIKIVNVNAAKLKIQLKVCDSFYAALMDSDGAVLKNYEGYVPPFMPGEHCGDYVLLDIDIDSGQITNWESPSRKQIEEFINGE